MSKNQNGKKVVKSVVSKSVKAIVSKDAVEKIEKKAIGKEVKEIKAVTPVIPAPLNKENAGKGRVEKTIKAPMAKSVKSLKNAIPPTKRNGTSPFRETSAYGKIYSILLKHKEMTREQLVKEAVKITGKDEKHAGYDISVVVSPDSQGSFHRSAKYASNFYYIEKSEGGKLKLVLRNITPVKTR